MNPPTDSALPDTLGLILREYLKAMPQRGRAAGERHVTTGLASALGRAELQPLDTAETSSFRRLSRPRM
jgi:hypothetical protein